jgi:hypothetical protein
MKTYRFLKRDSVDGTKIAGRIGKLSDREILLAIHNPDHSAAGVEALRAVIHQRGVTDEEIEVFRTSPEELDLPSFGKQPTFEEAIRRPKRWRLIYRGIQAVSLLLLVGVFYMINREESDRQAAVNTLIARGVVDGDAYKQQVADHSSSYIDDFNKEVLHNFGAPGADTGDTEERIGESLGLLLLVIYFPVKNLAWRSPARILLLRPFGTQQVSRFLTRFTRRNVMFSGHVFTLADQYMKESLFVYILSFVPLSWTQALLLLVYPLAKRTRRRIYVKTASDFEALKQRLGSSYLLSLFWTGSRNKVLKVRTVDKWWQRCIDLLAATCEVIVVDITLVKAGTRWELSKIHGQNLGEKTICIVHNEQSEAAPGILAEYWSGEALPELFTYDDKGRLEDPSGFADRFASILTLPRDPYTGPSRLYWWSVFSLFTWWFPPIGMPISLFAWYSIAKSGRRLKGAVLAQVSLGLGVLVSAVFVYLNRIH